jgi:predicted nucleotidyltransferase
MKNFGETIRKLREDRALPLRTVAAYLDIDQAILSKIERGLRKSTRQQVTDLAVYFGVHVDELMTIWLADKVYNELENEAMALEVLKVAEERVLYRALAKTSVTSTIEIIQETLKEDGRVDAAWLFGSFARNETTEDSDIDLMVTLKTDKKYSMFDLLEISFLVENKVKRKVDLVEKEYLKGFAAESAEHDLLKIYG